ncbi:phosphotransferase [Treponema sp. UBA7570]|uniref:phosphotransferase n=1 Tax=Treponema sp. UBA7570 TaxID=1947749 RepID=UPI0025E41C96|nr:phosphotransferase [Treponema sp. UBA7570]
MQEEILTGGRSTVGVVKIGNEVRRPHKNESDFANNFLQFLEKQNYPFSQRYLGRDEQGRDRFLFINGTVPKDIEKTNLVQLCDFMKMVRQFHDISLDFTNSKKVVCHNDLSPCNTVFQNNRPVGIIDWDSAAPGERWEDLTYILWLWINIGSHRRSEINILGQMKTALSAYNADKKTLANFADKLIWRMEKVISQMSPQNFQYERTKNWVEFSKLWVQENRIKLIGEIG